MSQQVDDPEHFGQFKEVLKNAIAKYGKVEEKDLLELQKKQVEGLDSLEREFQKIIKKSELGKLFYEKFIHHIVDKKRNVLSARPYFRERQTVFISKISDLIKKRDWAGLSNYHVNYLFISLVTDKYTWQTKEELEIKEIVNKIVQLRKELITMNMPLVINRATIFWNRTHKSHLSFMDLIQIGVEGLTSAIDKYCGKFRKQWRGVIIGRVVGNYIENLSQTMLHFYPTDKRKLYRANKFKSRHPHGDYDTDDLVAAINNQDQIKTNNDEISDLLAAASIVSCDTRPPVDEDLSDNLSHYEAPANCRPDIIVLEKESSDLMSVNINRLSLMDRKILRLKGLTVRL